MLDWGASTMAANAVTELERLKASGKLPVDVRSWRVERGVDTLNRRAVWVWLVVGREGLDPRESSVVRELVRDTVSKNVRDTDWVYVVFTDEEGVEP